MGDAVTGLPAIISVMYAQVGDNTHAAEELAYDQSIGRLVGMSVGR